MSSKDNHEIRLKNITVLFPDPTLSESYYEYWIPQDDLDLEELKQNIQAIKGVEKVEFRDNHKTLLKDWLENPPQFVFNQCDDGFMNKEEWEVHLVALMDVYGIPYTGPGVEGLSIVKDKSLVRGVAQSIGVPVPVEIYIDEHEDPATKIPDDMCYPAFAKLGNASGSTGVVQYGICHNKEESIQNIKKKRENYTNRPILLQEFLSGREISIGMVGNPECDDFEVFPPVEVDYQNLDLKYLKVQLEEFKRDGDSEFWQQVKEIKAELTDEQRKEIYDAAKKLFIRCRCKDFARMDFRMDSKGKFKIMDVNPNCWLGGKYRMMAEWAGYSWPQVLGKLVSSCQKRYELKSEKEKKIDAEKLLEKVEKQKQDFLQQKQQLNNNNNQPIQNETKQEEKNN